LANRKWALRCTAVLIVSLLSVGFYLLRRDPHSVGRIQELVKPAYNAQRPGGGRLFNTPYTAPGRSAEARANIGKAEILLLNVPESDTRRLNAQGLVYLANGDWEKFANGLYPRLPAQQRTEAATLNNLGASFLALSEENPTYLINALDAFERAAAADPKAEEPLFNLVIINKKLHFLKRADEAFRRYSTIDKDSPWHRELAIAAKIDEESIHDQLTLAADNHDAAELQRLFEANPELCRRIALQYSTLNEPESPALLRFIANQMEARYGDKTFSAMIEPLFGPDHDTIVAIREFVNEGATMFQAGAHEESLAPYAQAERLLTRTNSTFDRLWIDLNKADTLIKLGKFAASRQAIVQVVESARKNRFVWIAARALSIFGSTTKLTDSYAELLDRLSESDRTFAAIDAPHDRVRVLYYLSAYRHGAGDEEGALRLALECLLLVDNDRDAPVRLSTMDYLIGTILYRRGLSDRGLLFAKEAVEQAKRATYPRYEAATATVVAELYESESQDSLADQYIKIAQDAVSRMPISLERRRAELSLDLAKARLLVNQKKYKDAESLLQETLDIYSQQPFPATELLSQSFMLSARAYAETGRINEAAKKFNEAIDVVENDDEYLKTVTFDDQRRQLYDSAITFELNNGSLENAWKYVQKYRAKLFLEFLAAFDPKFDQTRAKLDPYEVQQRTPKDTQIVEYVLLKDKLLIWVISDNLFAMRPVEINRAALEDKVQTALRKLREEGDVDLLLADLGQILIGPVADLLDPSRVLVVIPDRALNGLPFEALRRPGKNQYLIEEFPIVESPSLTYFLAGAPNITPQRRDAIVAFGSQNGGASELRELSALKGIYSSAQLYSGQKVDKSTFLAEMNKATIFHYAGHSVTDAVDPLRSSILLDGNRSGPNSVTAVDISQQRLPNNAVVILSSCDSSVGNSRDGIGMRGLTSAFLIGGASAVVGSLWQVEEASTADLMIRFHRAFANSSVPVAKALRQAQLSIIHSSPVPPNPYYWSGFVVTGNFKALR
jgi:CHAT domain-containing protein